MSGGVASALRFSPIIAMRHRKPIRRKFTGLSPEMVRFKTRGRPSRTVMSLLGTPLAKLSLFYSGRSAVRNQRTLVMALAAILTVGCLAMFARSQAPDNAGQEKKAPARFDA